MTTLHTLRVYGSWIYRGIVGALALALGSALVAMPLSKGLPEPAVAALRLDALATLVATAGLVYLRRHIGFHLRRAVRTEAEKQRLSQVDELTGAVTRRHFMERLRDRIGTFRKSSAVTLLLLDVDEFKHLNDSFGHQIGDLALRAIVGLAQTHFSDGLVGRLGGDEFAILLPHDDSRSTEDAMNRFYAALNKPVRLDRYDVTLSASIGVAVAPLHTTRFDDLMMLADLALYESKARGRGRPTVFNPAMLSDRRQQTFMERELRAAIMLNRLELHYQPIINPDGSIFALEALVRWNHEYRGQIAPGEFIPTAERSMLIDALGAWVFRRACHDAAEMPGIRISVNVSAAQLQRDALVTMIRRTLAETKTAPDRFVIEITETAATAATPEVIARLKALRAMGMRVALDDFGTGHCGFNYLKTLPIDCVKIDRSYIRSMARDEVARIFVSSLNQIGRALAITIVAEGIETEDERMLAAASGCHRFQGFLICRPLARQTLLQAYPALNGANATADARKAS